MGWALLLVLLGLAFAPRAAAEVVWREDFEGPGVGNRWHCNEATWEIGKPAPISAHSGTNVLATTPEGRYQDWTSGLMVGPRFTVPAASENPRLRLWQWYSLNAGDYGEIQIKAGTNAPVVLAHYEWTHNDVWAYPAFSLAQYENERVQLMFYFYSSDSSQVGGGPEVDWGWYIDDVEVVTGQPTLPNPEGFEGTNVWDRWESTGGVWEIGAHSGPRGVEGNQLAATILNGNYSDWTYSRLASAPFLVPKAEDYPRLRLWHWYSFSAGDYGQVEIKAGTNDWKVLRRYEWTHSDTWDHPSLDLREYADQKVRLGFVFHSTDSSAVGGGPEVSWGWYIDDVEVVTGHPTLANPEGFEGTNVWDRWETTGGLWQIGASSVVGAHSGNQLAATLLNAKYTDWTYSGLIGRAFTVPSALLYPQLRFFHWHSFNAGDSGTVMVKAGSSDWQTLKTYTSHSSGKWANPWLDLSLFSGQEVVLGFWFYSSDSSQVGGGPEVDWGWYIDDVSIHTEALTTVNGRPLIDAKWEPFLVIEEHLLQLAFGAAADGLVFALGPGAPEGASIDPQLGIFTWIPPECQGPSTNLITITVTDPNNPTLQPLDSETITVIVEEEDLPPVIGEIGPIPIQVGVPVPFNATNHVYDPDCPAQVLTYSLDACSPANAGIDPLTGQLTWTPTPEQAAQTNTICLRVTDGALSTTASILAGPFTTGPRISSFRIDGTAIEIALEDAAPGQTWVLQSTSELKEPPGATVWIELPEFTWQSNPVRLDDILTGTEPIRFFRLKSSQP